ncbi:MAG: hypothetical protein ACR2N7_07880 [Acidimicrobiia bacterium]
MAGAVLAVILIVGVIALFLWLMRGRGAFSPDTGPKDDHQNWQPPGI